MRTLLIAVAVVGALVLAIAVTLGRDAYRPTRDK